jgi:hypothetical protein
MDAKGNQHARVCGIKNQESQNARYNGSNNHRGEVKMNINSIEGKGDDVGSGISVFLCHERW